MASSNANRPSPGHAQHGKTPSSSQDPDNPWDLESAEALTRAYEESEAEWREVQAARHPRPARTQQAGSAQDSALEGRLAEIAERLQRSIAGIDAGKSAAALGQRIDELEGRLAWAFEDVTRRLDGHSLEGVEAQIGGLATHLQHTRGQLERLDAIDERLRDLAIQVEEQRRQPARLDDAAIQTLIETAASRAATRVAENLPPPAAGIQPGRLDVLEKILQDEIAERRRAEETTSGVLRTIEEALARILDRVDDAGPASFASFLPRDPAAPVATGDPLLEAYARGAQALGQPVPASLLDASDYATSLRRPAVAATEPSLTPHPVSLEAQADDKPALDLESRGTPPMIDVAEAADPGAGATVRARTRPFAAASGRRSSLLLLLAMVLLGGAGYMTVDTYLAQMHLPLLADPTAMRQAAATSAPAVRAIPVSATVKQASAQRNEAVVPSDGTGLPDRASRLPEAIGAADLRQAATTGDPQAQFEVASRFAEGRGVARDDAQAFAWFQRAAAHGFGPAQFRVAGLFERGLGVTADVERAKLWYRRAAEQGHVKAMHNLAVLNAKTEATADYVVAAKWFQEAAERGLADSQYNLAVLYQGGLGAPKSLSEAYKWFALAARAGDKEAGHRLERLKAQLDPAELATAERQVEAWRAQRSETKPASAASLSGADAAEVGG